MQLPIQKIYIFCNILKFRYCEKVTRISHFFLKLLKIGPFKFLEASNCTIKNVGATTVIPAVSVDTSLLPL